MKTETFAQMLSDIDETFVEAAEKRAPREREGKGASSFLRIAAVAAAAVLLAGAVFAAVKLASGANGPEEEAYVLPPERTCTQNVVSNVKRLGFPTLVKEYADSDAICEITIESWLSEDDMNTYHRAKVDRVYKGELPDTITFRQYGCSACPSDFPIYTHGNRLLVFLVEREDLKAEYPDLGSIYELTAHDLSALYIARAGDGKDYLIDYDVLLSYNTKKKCPGIALDDVGTRELLAELAESVRPGDGLLADDLLNGASPHSDLGSIKVYDLEKLTALLTEKASVEAWKEPATVPEDAVLPPARQGVGNAKTSYVKTYNYAEAYEEADAVCIVTVENWLEDVSDCCYFEAKVEKIYKGEIPERIVLRQNESKDFSFGSPIFTYGNRLLVFLDEWEYWDEAGEAYYQIGSDLTTLYMANDASGELYLIALHGLVGNKSRGLGLKDKFSLELAQELGTELKKSDEVLGETVELYAHDDPPYNIKIYLFDDFESFLDSMN